MVHAWVAGKTVWYTRAIFERFSDEELLILIIGTFIYWIIFI